MGDGRSRPWLLYADAMPAPVPVPVPVPVALYLCLVSHNKGLVTLAFSVEANSTPSPGSHMQIILSSVERNIPTVYA